MSKIEARELLEDMLKLSETLGAELTLAMMRRRYEAPPEKIFAAIKVILESVP